MSMRIRRRAHHKHTNMKHFVNNHNDYRLFEYENDLSNSNFELGQIIINEDDEVGVVIQLHPDGIAGQICLGIHRHQKLETRR